MTESTETFQLQAGPIDLRLHIDGESQERRRAIARAREIFPAILPELASELGDLRRANHANRPPPSFRGEVARRMADAVQPLATRFITPMAAVAGAVADHMLEAVAGAARLRRAWINNGGDIALYLTPGTSIRLALVGNIAAPAVDGLLDIDAASPVRGVATSGWRGRSFSLGIADSVTVLAGSAAMADAAATLIANEVTIDDPAISRLPAFELDPDSDLGERLVTVDVGALPPAAIHAALARGLAEAHAFLQAGHIVAAALSLGGEMRIADPSGSAPGFLPVHFHVGGKGEADQL